MTHSHGRGARFRSSLLVLLVLGLLAPACGGGGGDDGGSPAGGDATTTSGGDAEPVAGGRIVYGLESESSGGWCLPEAQLALSGAQVARAVYEPLTMPNADGEYVPYLATAVTPNADFTEWTIELPEGVTFHDGSPLTAEVVKNNLDAFRGAYEGRTGLLLPFVYENIAEVTVAGPLTVVVTAKTPWRSFPAFLNQGNRFGIMGQAQLDDPDHCDENLVGTGPFRLEEWKLNRSLVVVRNESYRIPGLPYLDEIEFRPIHETVQRLNALEAGEIDVMHAGTATAVADLRELAERGDVGLVESDRASETTYLMLNTTRAPFDSLDARLALAHALDLETLNQIRNLGIPPIANGPFPPGSLGYLEDSGFPTFDPATAEEHVAAYEEATGEKISFSYTVGPEPGAVEWATLVEEAVEAVGMEMTINSIEQSQLISDAIAGNFQAVGVVLHGGTLEPDTEHAFWRSGSLLNLGKFSDPEIDRLLDEGRAEPDPARRIEIYQELNRRFAEQVWNVWTFWGNRVVASAPEVHGILGPDLPDGSGPFTGLAAGHSLAGLWIEP